jgi:glycosyltransferase involved in cell wall biosynthesis
MFLRDIVVTKKKLRILFGPFHIGGMLWEYRTGLRALGVDAKVVVFLHHPFDYPADIEFQVYGNGNKYLKHLKLILLRFIITSKLIYNYDVFHFVFGESFCRYKLDVFVLKFFQKKIVMHFVGSEIRPRKIAEDEMFNLSKKKKTARFWEKYADAIISFPEYSQLLTKKYNIIPLGYDLEYWKPFKPKISIKNDGKILIVHAPSNREKKGTEYIIKAIEKLKENGYEIEFKLLEALPNSEIREWVNISDIVVDQLIIGWHGIFAIESMALGKTTLCYINEDWKKDVSYAKSLPLVNTTPDTIYSNLKLLIENPDLRTEIGQKSRKYVEEVHDSKKVAKQLLEFYESL